MLDLAQTTGPHAAALDLAKRAMVERRYADAAAAADTVLANAPESFDARYIAVVSARCLGRFDEAGVHLDALRAIAPEQGRVWQERGYLARDRGDVPAAAAAFRDACRINPALVGSWIGLAECSAALGRSQQAAAAQGEASRLRALPRELIAVATMFHDGALDRAEALCRHFLAVQPDHPEGLRLFAMIAGHGGFYDDARVMLERAMLADPDDAHIRIELIRTLNGQQDYVAAHKEAQALHARDPHEPAFQTHLAAQALNLGAFEQALELFQAAADAMPEDPHAATSHGHVLKTIGRQDAAIQSFRAAIARRPEHGEAYYSLANLKTFRFADADVEAMARQLERVDLAPIDHVHFLFALAKAKEERGQHRAAFELYDRGNALKRRQTGYNAQQMHDVLARQIALCPRALFERRAGTGCPAPDPIFIVGLPRAGSTLLEQILASHSQIDGTHELPGIPALAHRLEGRGGAVGYPAILQDLDDDALRAHGEAYLALARVHRQGAPFFIDKMPNNFRHIGLIRLILPNAKIIDARRDPLDCCWSGFKQLFASGQEFTYGLREIGRYYRDYDALMAHWDTALGEGAILRVQHEAVLDDLEGQVRRILDHLGLGFEPACLEFHANARAVRTASSEQVRRPINRDGVGSWRPFAPWIMPLKEALRGEW